MLSAAPENDAKKRPCCWNASGGAVFQMLFFGLDREKFQKDMQNIIEMVERLPEMETGDLSPRVEDTMTLREDMVEPSLPRDEVLKNAPQVAAGCVVVPKTVG